MKYCGNLQSITLPSKITSIGDYAFLNCTSLLNLTLQSETPPTLGEGAFEGTATLLKIYVPASAVSAYQKADGWKSYTSRIQAIPE